MKEYDNWKKQYDKTSETVSGNAETPPKAKGSVVRDNPFKKKQKWIGIVLAVVLASISANLVNKNEQHNNSVIHGRMLLNKKI